MFEVTCPSCQRKYASPLALDYMCEECETRFRNAEAQRNARRGRALRLAEYNARLLHRMPAEPARWRTEHPTGNAAASAALRDIASLLPAMAAFLVEPARALHIYGDNATGKTHLSYWLGHERKHDTFVFYTSGPEFWRLIASSWGGGKEAKAEAAAFVGNAAQAELLILDEVHALDRSGDGDGVWKDLQYVLDSVASRHGRMIAVANQPVDAIISTWIATSQPTHAKRAVASRIGYTGMPREFSVKTLDMDAKGVKPWIQRRPI